MATNIEVFGNSNSIMTFGWLSYLKSYRKDLKVRNLSIGGSPSPALLNQALSSSRNKDKRIAIIEPCVIDHCETWQNSDELSYYARKTVSLLREYASVIVLGLPRFENNIKLPSRGQEIWKSEVHKQGGIYLDGSELIGDLLNTEVIKTEEIWIDESGHFSELVQKAIAAKMEEVINRIEVKLNEKEISPNEFFNWFKNHEELANLFESATIKNSLINEKFFNLSNATITFNEKFENLAVHGIKLDYQYITKECIILSVDGETVSKFNLYNSFARNSGKPIVLFKKLYIPLNCNSKLIFKSLGDAKILASSILIGPRI